MRILLLTQWYPPDPNRIFAELALGLKQRGHEVTVLTAIPNYPTEHFYPGYKLRLWQRETLDGIPVIRLPLYPSHGRAIKRIANFLTFAASCSILGPWVAPRVDVVYAIHPPVTIGLPAWLISRLQRIPFVHEIQDMWPETLEATGMVSRKWMLKMVGRLASWLDRRAARIRVISPGFRRNLIDKGVSAEKISVISNWVDTELFHPAEPDRELAEKHGLAGHFNVMYAGNIGLAQGLETFLEAAELLRDTPEVQFLIVGDGPDGERIRTMAREKQLANVKFLGRFPMEKMPGIHALADVLLVHLRDDPLFRITIPHKMFACMACAKPVLMAIDGDGAEIIRSAEAGLSCPSGDPSAMADAIRKFHAMTPAAREAMGANGLRTVRQCYSQEYLTGQISEMLEAVHADHQSKRGR